MWCLIATMDQYEERNRLLLFLQPIDQCIGLDGSNTGEPESSNVLCDTLLAPGTKPARTTSNSQMLCPTVTATHAENSEFTVANLFKFSVHEACLQRDTRRVITGFNLVSSVLLAHAIEADKSEPI